MLLGMIDELTECGVVQEILEDARDRLVDPLAREAVGNLGCFVGPGVVPLVFLAHEGCRDRG